MTTTLTLRTYLDSRRTTGTNWNVTGLGPGKTTGPPDENKNWLGKFAIPDDEYDAFLTLVHDHVFTKGRACSLLEKHKPQSPVLIDLDFRYAGGGPLRRRFTSEQVREFVAAYADAFARFFGPLPDGAPLHFYVMTKPGAETEKDVHKDGVHIVCPGLTTTPEIQYALRGWILQTGVVERIFGSTGMTNEPTDCFDISVVARNNWFLYGACKPDKAWYKVTDIYAAEIPEEYDPADPLTADHLEREDPTDTTPLSLIKLLSLRLHHDKSTELALRAGSAGTEVEWTQLLQRWGKGSNWVRTKSPGMFAAAKPVGGAGILDPEDDAISLVGGAASSSAVAPSDMMQVSGLTVSRGKISTEELSQVYRLVRECLLPIRRAKNYHDWVNLGLLLHNISESDETCMVWAEISRRVPGYGGTPDSTFREKWKLLPAEVSAQQKGRKALSAGTLHWWAKEDSPSTYRDILREVNTELAVVNDSGTHVSVADLVVKMYQHEFRCCPARKGTSASAMDWYQFPPDEHTWRSLKTWHRLRERLSTDVRNIYLEALQQVLKRTVGSTEESERQRLDEKRKKLTKVEQHLQNYTFKESVMKESAEKFYDEDFLGNMNKDATLVGFSNGVLELRHTGADGKPHIHFRDGRPDDCISFQMGRGSVGLDSIPYIPYNPAAPAPEHLEILDFFSKIYPDPALRDYCLTLFSACLEGSNTEQLFWVMTGKGGNGKSKIVDLMSKTFGEYQETLPVTAITRKRADAGSATPEMIVIKDKRFVSMMEPEEGEKINTSLMKQLTGGDVVKARGLFQDQDQFIVTARIFMSCNNLPPVSSMDEGTWRRIRVIPHVAKFEPPGVPTNPAANIHPRDPLMDTKIIRWRPYFAGLLAWYFDAHYLRGHLKEPPQVSAASDMYRETNDSFSAFCSESLVKEIGTELRIGDLMIAYKEWCKYNPAKKVMQKNELMERMKAIYGAPIDGKAYGGVRLAEEGEDMSGNYVSL
jgi:P4 family phage/plasmid primase-like protien